MKLKPPWDITPHLLEWLSSKRKTTSVGKTVEGREPLCTGDNVNGAATMGNSMEIPQKLNIELPYDLAIPLLGVHPKETKHQLEKISVPPHSEQHSLR